MNVMGINVFAPGRRMLASAVVALAAGMSASAPASAGDDYDRVECSARTLRGAYQFAASGHNIVNGVAVPKAIILTLLFDGIGNVTTPEVALSVNGFIIQPPQGSPGVYTVNADCTGTLQFADGINYALHIRPNGKSVNMLQTNTNTVSRGTAEKVAPLNAWPQ